MKAFAVDKFGVNAGSVICGNIVCYRKQKYDKIGSVPMAPNRFRLIEFGGDMTIEEFRANSLRDEGVSKHVETSAHVERLIPFTSAIEEASMDLLDLDNKHFVYILMHDQLSQPVLVLSVSITQAYLLIIFAVEAD